jgi:hypothetical protein
MTGGGELRPRLRGNDDSRFEWFEAEVFGEVAPVGVFSFDQLELPGAVTFLDAFLAGDCRIHRRVLLEPDELLYGVFAGEAAHGARAVLMDAGEEVRGYADVERAVALRCEEIDAGLKVLMHRDPFFVIAENAGT